MEWPLAITIAIPASSFIVMSGSIILRSMNNKKGSKQKEVPRKELDSILERKLDGVIYEDTCDATQKRIEQKIDLMVRNVTDKMDMVEKNICNQLGKVETELGSRRTE